MPFQKYKKIAFLFPGQGSQFVGMLSEINSKFPIFSEIFSEASSTLGYDLLDLVLSGPKEKLDQTTYTQPSLLSAEFALWKIFCSKFDVKPAFLCGHSLGEYSALVCAEALDFIDAINLVATRGFLMQQAVGQGKGGMAAIVGLSNSKISEICETASEGQIIEPANYNSVGQTVISGELSAINRAIEIAKSSGAKLSKLLPVSVPSHCKLMKKAAEDLEAHLSTIQINTPKIPVINNADVHIYENNIDIRDGLVKQLHSAVRWVETIEYLSSTGVDCFIEFGPGNVLSGLNKRIVDSIPTISIEKILLSI